MGKYCVSAVDRRHDSAEVAVLPAPRERVGPLLQAMNEVSTGEPGVTEKLSRHQPHPSDMTASVKSALWGLWVSALLVFRAIEKESRQTPLSAGGAAAAPRPASVFGVSLTCVWEQQSRRILKYFRRLRGVSPQGNSSWANWTEAGGNVSRCPPSNAPRRRPPSFSFNWARFLAPLQITLSLYTA